MYSQKNIIFDSAAIKSVWNSKPLLMSQALSEKNQLPDITELLARINGRFEHGLWEQPISVDINASSVSGGAGFQQHLGVERSNIQSLYSSGFTLCFGDISNQILSLTELKSVMSELFGSKEFLQITAYLSPPCSIGVLHFDRQHNFFLQKEGCKRWFVSEVPGIENPYDNLVFPSVTQDFIEDLHEKGYKVAMPKDCGRSEFFLEPGDVLYVPPGFYHSPETEELPSLHYTLTVESDCFWKDMNRQIFAALLENCKDLNQDLRFLSPDEKASLLEKCRKILANIKIINGS